MANVKCVVVKQLPRHLGVEESLAFLQEVEPCLTADRPRLVFDCCDLQRLDSAGVQVLLHCLEEAMKRKGDVKLAYVHPNAADVLKLTRVDSLFEIFDNVNDAVNSFYQCPIYTYAEGLQPELLTLTSERVT